MPYVESLREARGFRVHLRVLLLTQPSLRPGEVLSIMGVLPIRGCSVPF